MKTCDDCFEDFKPQTKDQTVCNDCKPVETEYSLEQCIHIWKCCCSGGFKSQEHIDEFQKVKKTYEKLTGRKLTKIDEKIKRKKNG